MWTEYWQNDIMFMSNSLTRYLVNYKAICTYKNYNYYLIVLNFASLLFTYLLFLILLKYSLCKILCYFQENYIVTWYLHTLCNGHHNKSSNHLPPYKVITAIVTIFLIYYIPEACLFCNWKFVPLNLLHLFCLTLPHASPLATTSSFAVWLTVSREVT